METMKSIILLDTTAPVRARQSWLSYGPSQPGRENHRRLLDSWFHHYSCCGGAIILSIGPDPEPWVG